jgi:hypothetical protein
MQLGATVPGIPNSRSLRERDPLRPQGFTRWTGPDKPFPFPFSFLLFLFFFIVLFYFFLF